jgi:hypothetical protein
MTVSCRVAQRTDCETPLSHGFRLRADARFNLGKVLARTPGRPPNAIAEFEAAARISHDAETK